MVHRQGACHGVIASTHPRPDAEINIIPLANVMLVLLIIFMIATPAFDPSGQTEPAGRQSRQGAAYHPPPIRLRIDAAGQVSWSDSATPLSALPAMMTAGVVRESNNTPRLEIDASGDSDYQDVASVLAAARNADMVRAAFVRK